MATVDRRGVSVNAVDTPTAGVPNADLAVKTACLVATTANITLSGLQTIDGVAVGANAERVLVWQQADAKTNGIYNASSGNWTRAADARSNSQWANGLQVVVTSGTTYGHAVFQCRAADPITLGTSAITFADSVLALPAPTLTTIGGVKAILAAAHQWIVSIDLTGTPHLAQPDFADLSGNIAVGQMAGGVGANVNSFWRGDGAWASLAGAVTSIAGQAGAFTLSHGLTNSVNDLQIDVGVIRDYLAGLTLSTAGSSATFSVAAGAAVDATNSDFIKLAAAISKTTASWAVGSGSGSLDTGTIATGTWYHAYVIKRPDTGVVDVLTSQAPNLTATATATNASPAVFTWNGGTALPFLNGTPVKLAGGSAPTGFTLGTQYYVVSANVAAGTFQLSASQGGAAINSTSTGSGFSAAAVPVLPANYTLARLIGSMKTDGSSHWTKFTQIGDDFLLDVAVADVSASTAITNTNTLYTLASVPPGRSVMAHVNVEFSNSAGAAGALISSPLTTTQLSGVPSGHSTVFNPSAGTFSAGQVGVLTDVAGRVNASATVAANNTVYIITYGFTDRRGRDA